MKTKNYLKILMAVLIWLPVITMAQGVAINDDNSEADPSAILDVKSDNMGFLLPRVADTGAINNPAEGLMIYDLSSHCLKYYNGSIWSDCIGLFWECGYALTDERDGNEYGTIQIGDQCWMAENLNVGTYMNSSNNVYQSNNGVIEKYCYGNSTSNCDTYGGLYSWKEMMQYTTTEEIQGICPVGWHLPSDAEWNTLFDNLGGISVAGGKLKKDGIEYWNSPNTGATNESGFNAMPGGYSYVSYSGGFGGQYVRYFTQLNNQGNYYSSTGDGASVNSFKGLGYNFASVVNSTASTNNAYSVRCIKD